MNILARFAIRKDGKLILGKHFGGLTPGNVYEIRGVPELEAFDLIEVGPSCAVPNLSEATKQNPQWRRLRPCWGWDANHLSQDGNHLFTAKEMDIKDSLLPPLTDTYKESFYNDL